MFIPDELQMEVKTGPYSIPPVVYAHFLCFLCRYHQKKDMQCLDSLRDLHLTVYERYFIANNVQEGISYNILGISFYLIGYTESAKEAFIESTRLHPDPPRNCAFERLSLIG